MMPELFDVISNEDYDLFITLLESKNANILVKNEEMWTLLHAAVSENRFDMVQYLLRKERIPVDSQCKEGKSSLLLACELEDINLKIVTGILEYGADVNIASIDDVTPLHAACRNGNVEVARILLRCNADVNAKDRNGYTPLHYTALSNCVQTLRLLLGKSESTEDEEEEEDVGAVDIDAPDVDGCTPLMLAVDVANVDVAIELIENGADVNIIGRESTALHLSVVTQQSELFQLLWAKTDFKIIADLSECNNLLKVMVKFGWFFPDRVELLFQVLDHPNILLLLGKRVKILQTFFYRIRFVKNVYDINICDVLRRFLQVGIPVYQCELRAFIQNFYRYEHRYEMLDILINNGEANFDHMELIIFAVDLFPNLVPTLLSVCIRVNPLDLFQHFSGTMRINKNTLKLLVLVLYLCTPSAPLRKRCRINIMTFSFAQTILENGLDSDMVQCYNQAICALKIQSIPSLRELSRDKVRKCLSAVCANSYKYLNMLNNLLLPKDIVDLIQCKMAVNLI